MDNLDYSQENGVSEPSPVENITVSGIRQSDEGRITGPKPSPAADSIPSGPESSPAADSIPSGQLNYSTPESSPAAGAVESEYASMSEDELDEAMASEIEILQELNSDVDYDYDEVSIPLVEGAKSLRLVAQGNLAEAEQLIIKTAEAASRMPGMDAAASQQQISALRTFLPTVDSDSPKDMAFLAEIVKKIYGLRAQGD